MKGAKSVISGEEVRNTLLPRKEFSIHPGLEQVAKRLSGSVDQYFDELVDEEKEPMPKDIANRLMAFASGLNIKKADQIEIVNALRDRGLDKKRLLPVLAMVAAQAALFPALNDEFFNAKFFGEILSVACQIGSDRPFFIA